MDKLKISVEAQRRIGILSPKLIKTLETFDKYCPEEESKFEEYMVEVLAILVRFIKANKVFVLYERSEDLLVHEGKTLARKITLAFSSDTTNPPLVADCVCLLELKGKVVSVVDYDSEIAIEAFGEVKYGEKSTFCQGTRTVN